MDLKGPFIIYTIEWDKMRERGLYNVHLILWGSLVFVTAFGGGVIKIVVNISAECEIYDKYDSLIPGKVLIIKQQQLYKLTVISLTVISK